MGTLADKLQYLKDTKDAIMNAIIEKGIAITSSDTFRSYADKIKSITSGDKPIVYDTVSSIDKSVHKIPILSDGVGKYLHKLIYCTSLIFF